MHGKKQKKEKIYLRLTGPAVNWTSVFKYPLNDQRIIKYRCFVNHNGAKYLYCI